VSEKVAKQLRTILAREATPEEVILAFDRGTDAVVEADREATRKERDQELRERVKALPLGRLQREIVLSVFEEDDGGGA
jgi:hypothetical protein